MLARRAERQAAAGRDAARRGALDIGRRLWDKSALHTRSPTMFSTPHDAPPSKFLELRARHPSLVYAACWHEAAGDTLRFGFHFRLEPEVEFTPTTTVSGLDAERLAAADAAVLRNLVFNVGLIELLSYWKAACPARIDIRAGAVEEAQLAWLRGLLGRGLREFFSVHRIDFRRPELVAFAPAQVAPPALHDDENGARDLLLLSGGRDSALALRLLDEAAVDFDCLVVNDQPGAARLLARYGAHAVRVRREIDPRLLELNRLGYLNGHTPFSAYLAALGVLCSAAGGFGRVVVANERSSEHPHGEFLGEPVNHQYSKTFAFERGFAEFARRWLSRSVTYFSLLRPLYEIQISRLFAARPSDLELVRSCNRLGIGDAWCCRCPKCVSSFVLLDPFFSDAELRAGFGGDPYEIEDNVEQVRRLLAATERPFECVATPEEILVALDLGLKKARSGRTPLVLGRVADLVAARAGDLPRLAEEVTRGWGAEHLLPPRYEAILRRALGR
jgi:hypothetical protein